MAPILAGLKKRAFDDDGISAADQATMDANPVVWRATGQYMARKLNGIWATAPYLHNGSVPTLYHLLYPEQRPARFLVGNREYDPVKLGFQSESASMPLNVWRMTPLSRAIAISATAASSSAPRYPTTTRQLCWSF